MSCSSCTPSDSNCCSSTLEENADLLQIITDLASGKYSYDDESLSLLSEYIVDGNYSAHCKLLELFQKFCLVEKDLLFFKLCKFFLLHSIRGVFVFWMLEEVDEEVLLDEQSFIYSESIEKVNQLINNLNARLEEYLAFNPSLKINKLSLVQQ